MPAPKTVTLNAYTVNIKVGDVIRLKEFYDDGTYNSPYTLEWTSSDKAVSIESRSGYLVTLKAKALGTSVITAKTYNGKTAKCTVTVSGSNVKCIDISSWQGSNVDFNKIKASGINYVILRSGFRTTADNQFVNYYNKAKAAGLKIGSYWYMCARNVNEAKQEAEACIKVLGGRKLDLPVYYDVEEPDVLSNRSQAELTNMSVAFCDALSAKGYKVGIYSSGSVYARNNKLNTDLLRKKGYSIWDAEWASSNTIVCDVWQYADNGNVSGISGYVDMDLIFNLYIED
jgi:GH25 family lysozyme M1 (1,4-beta-N-acetylmuramidase)